CSGVARWRWTDAQFRPRGHHRNSGAPAIAGHVWIPRVRRRGRSDLVWIQPSRCVSADGQTGGQNSQRRPAGRSTVRAAGSLRIDCQSQGRQRDWANDPGFVRAARRRGDRMTSRREFIMLLGGAVATWPLVARAQQPTPIVGLINGRSAQDAVRNVAAFRKGLDETGYVEGQNVMVEYHWLEGQFDRLPAVMADLVRRRPGGIATPAFCAGAQAAKAATSTIPIVFGVGDGPVKLGLVASLARPGGNVTGVNSFNTEVVTKRIGLLHDLLPKAVRIVVLVNPANAPIA